MKLSSKLETFVVHFGEMGSRWGFNRTVGQMLALMVIYPRPLNADDISEALHISRGNVSMGIKELQSWRLIKVHRVAGDRKDYYSAAGDISTLALTVIEERRKREVEPTLSILRSGLLMHSENEVDDHANQKMQEILNLLEQFTQWADQLQRLSPQQLEQLLSLGSGVSKILEFKDRFTRKKPSP